MLMEYMKFDFNDMKKYEYVMTIKILDVFYTVSPTGKIGISIQADAPQFKTFQHKLQGKKFTNQTEYYVGDIIEIYQDVINGDTYYCVRTNGDTDGKFISVTYAPTVCPCCGKRLTRCKDDFYCYNSLCIAKLLITIKRFVSIALYSAHWTSTELQLITQLVTQRIVEYPHELYQLTMSDLDGFGYKESFIKAFLDKLSRTRGTVTLYDYLQSINVEHERGWFIDKNKIDNEFEDVNDFIQWWYYLSNIDDEEEFAHSFWLDIEPVMSEEAFRSITDYFSYEENIIIMQELADHEVFC